MNRLCSYCGDEHENYNHQCREQRRVTERMMRQIASRHRRSIKIRIVWPPEESTLSRWWHHGIECAVATGTFSLCGYVRVLPCHPYERADYDNVPVEVHGGLTYRCRAAEGGAWFGFDCNHAGDYSQLKGMSDPGDRQWDAEAVQEEVNRLAEQMAALIHGERHPRRNKPKTSRSRSEKTAGKRAIAHGAAP